MARVSTPWPLLKVVNLVNYQVAWLACVAGAAQGWYWLGPIVVALLTLFHLTVMPHRRRELVFLLLVGVLGFAIDTAHAAGGAFSFAERSNYSWLCPPWMAALWVIFATLFHSSLAWLRGRYLLGAALGAVGGPLAYYAGARIGAITLGPLPALGLLTVAGVWALATPLLLRLSQWVLPNLTAGA